MTVSFMYNFCNISNKFPHDFLKFNVSYLSPPSKTLFRSKSTLDSLKSAFRRKPSLGAPVSDDDISLGGEVRRNPSYPDPV